MKFTNWQTSKGQIIAAARLVNHNGGEPVAGGYGIIGKIGRDVQRFLPKRRRPRGLP
jgi:hypothetical protein